MVLSFTVCFGVAQRHNSSAFGRITIKSSLVLSYRKVWTYHGKSFLTGTNSA